MPGTFDETRLLIFTTTSAVVDVSSLLFNGLLIFLIVFHTSTTFRSYSIAMLAVALADFVMGASYGFAQVRMVPLGGSLVFIFHGSCRHFGPDVCLTAHLTTVHATAYMSTLLPVSFWYRHRVLSKEIVPSPWHVAFVCFIIYVPALVSLILCVLSGSTSQEMYEIMEEHHFVLYPNDSSKIAVSGLVDIFQKNAIYLNFWICFPAFPSYVISIAYRQRILKAIHNSALSDKTKEMQRKLITALTIQAFLPLIYLSQASLYVWKQFRLPYHESIPYYEEWIFESLAILSALNPVISMYFVLPYRQKLQNIFIKPEPKIFMSSSTVQSITTRWSLPAGSLHSRSSVAPGETILN